MRVSKEVPLLLWGLWLVCLVVAVGFVVAVIMFLMEDMPFPQLQIHQLQN